ncbi:UDP-2,4-diacetamido-2,4,6-trideoxy-beta-L-altropyranose hydrolase [Mariprofundus sp. NF]|uniref:UDP-2,4-diacetamido-2,4, 6-trideoxy-beta-L-altropyranose hydrolase n=1 Tax=Mariprofundus sp. NF TaxID=2608716 RepID=UPI00159F8841|nr:UDP-2,4-diacetamido-2,4,6-trideoxy-beta-L-altropyranose hydrolase [Mariprofundus sp. NF]NWF37924.1 UDP-2,4-diacetamido-2,4,6-trideoxy-beta-L-altropyranose hydrolase [Mariprofundus sp. NF]
MKVAIRVDASSQIGTGHFMRCLTLAETLQQRGMHVRFVCRHLPVHLRDMLTSKTIELALYDVMEDMHVADDLAHAHWLGVSQDQDAQDMIQALSDKTWDWVIVDHYGIDQRWETTLRGALDCKMLVIDDLADRKHDCDVLLDQNFYADMDLRYIGKVPAHCRLLLGPGYALLREEFRKLHGQIKPRRGPVVHVLVFFGGVDADDYTGRTIKVLSEIGISGLNVDVVIGAQHPCCEEIKSSCALHGFVCHIQTDKMAELMATADLAIGAGGSSTWERCSMGLPSVIMVLAENQNEAAKDLEAAGVLINLGDAKLVTNEKLSYEIRKLMEDVELRYKLSVASLKLVPVSKHSGVVEVVVGHDV